MIAAAVVLFSAPACAAPAVPSALRLPELPAGYRTASFPEATFAFRPGIEGRERAAARLRARFGEARRRVERKLGRGPAALLVVEAPDRRAFNRVLRGWTGEDAPPFAAAVAIPARGLIVLDGSAARLLPPADTASVLAHELAHIAVHEITRDRPLPRWFDEGVASWIGHGPLAGRELDDLAFLASRRALYSLQDLETRFPGESHRLLSIAYLQSTAFVRWLEARGGPGTVVRALRMRGAGRTLPEAIEAVCGRPLAELDRAFRSDLARSFRPLRWILRSFSLFTLIALLAVAAFARSRWVRRRRLQTLDAEDPGR